jgi:class 3 adenylate cyclase
VIAGVIGHKKFAYDVWGDAVNTASRMESQGIPGKIQITQATYELLKDDFVCESHGTIDVKGIGQMETWFLVGQKEASR